MNFRPKKNCFSTNPLSGVSQEQHIKKKIKIGSKKSFRPWWVKLAVFKPIFCIKVILIQWEINIFYLFQVMREYVTKVDRLEDAENQRITEKKETEYKPVVMGKLYWSITTYCHIDHDCLTVFHPLLCCSRCFGSVGYSFYQCCGAEPFFFRLRLHP